VFYRVDNIPVHSCLLMPSREAALSYPKRDLQLGWCPSCGFIQNTVFDTAVHEYSTRYEETQAFSPTFNAFARDLAQRLVDRYDLRGKEVLEIGCGKGEFLVLLCELGNNRGIGIDPGYVPARTSSPSASRIRFIQDFYSEAYAGLTADFVCCRHTLEHIHPTRRFVETVRRTIGDRTDTVVFFEVPDVGRVLKERAFWDIYYEHCSYFSAGSLARLFRSCGFELLELARAFDDQYLIVAARPGRAAAGHRFELEDDLDELAADVAAFEADHARTSKEWRERLAELQRDGRRAVLWGSGSKAVAFLTTLGLGDEIDYVIDINPFKHGMYMVGTGHRIMPPATLRERPADVVIVMNAIYLDEIRRDVAAMGVSAELLTV
jgi:SAM-dependent methyltransferase